MKNSLKLNHSLKQTFNFSKNIESQINMLSMNQKKLSETLKEIASTNPFLEYTPSQDLNQYLDQGIASKPSLQEELYFQLHTQNRKYNKKITEYIIESLDEHGFFTTNIQEACSDLKVAQHDFIKNLELIQSFEPTGVAATSFSDSLYIQLNKLGYTKAANLIKNYSKEIEQGSIDTILKEMNITLDTLQDLLSQVRMCNPHPCSEYSSEPTIVIIPEFEIIKENNELIIEPKTIGKLNIQESLEKELSKEAKEYFNQAKFYVDSINKRNKTLLILTNELINIQKNHFLYDDKLNSCTLEDISKATGFAISTVSRVLSNKYYLYENQIYPVKDLFVSKTKLGTSKDAILKELTYLIETEDKSKPYSDEKLVKLLSKYNLFVSRRAVSKYRLSLNIPPASKRKTR